MRRALSNAIRFFQKTENGLAVTALAVLAALPVLELVLRTFLHTGVHASSDYIKHAVLWITFIGSIITSREKRHLRLTAGIDLLGPKYKQWIRTFTAFVSVAVCTVLARWSWTFIRDGFEPDMVIGIFPAWGVLAVMPFGFAVLALRLIFHAGEERPLQRIIAASGILAAVLLALWMEQLIAVLIWPLCIILTVTLFFGAPIFVILGGLTILLFSHADGSLAVIPNEAYTMLTGPIMPTIPLFTLAGFIMSESKAGERLVRFMQACFGWMPGGLAVMAIITSAFFTTFTGASGVTILALGGLLSFVLINSRYERDFSLGLLTASGSMGLLFPPSLPIILYGVIAQINIKSMFAGGLLPGVLMVAAVALFSILYAGRKNITRTPFRPREVLVSLKNSIWELLLPVIILTVYLTGIATLVETAAISVIYTVLVETVIQRDIRFRDLPGVFIKCIPIMGGVLIILAIAKGFSYFIVDAEVPLLLSGWVTENIGSKYVFLILLNLALLVTGSLMDIFSAIIVVVPLILPLGEAFGIHPVHLGIIFLANMELGYLTPPVGINLFLASYRFNEPLGLVYRQVLPFLFILLVAVLLITYLPVLSTGLLPLFGF